MRKGRFSIEQIIAVLKQLHEEKGRLQRLVAELSLDMAILQDVASRNCAARAEEAGGGIHRGPPPHQPALGLPLGQAASQQPVLAQPQGPAARPAATDARSRSGTGPLWLQAHPRPLRGEGWQLGRNQAYRLYREEGLQPRSKLPKRRKVVVVRRERIRPRRPDHAWSLEFVADQLADGRRFRALTVLDVYTREALAIEVGAKVRGEDVVATLDRVAEQRGRPSYPFVDNGREFFGRLLDLWAYRHKLRVDFSRPGKPTDN